MAVRVLMLAEWPRRLSFAVAAVVEEAVDDGLDGRPPPRPVEVVLRVASPAVVAGTWQARLASWVSTRIGCRV